MNKKQAIKLIILELESSLEKFPDWPVDPVHASGIVNEEAGELMQASLQHIYEPEKSYPCDSKNRMASEAVQVGAMAIRFLMGLDNYEAVKSKQKSQLK